MKEKKLSECEFEQLLNFCIPEYFIKTQGASMDQIEQIEKLINRPLPDFYRWFLEKMGGKNHSSEFGYDFSARAVLGSNYSGDPIDEPFFISDEQASPVSFWNVWSYNCNIQSRGDAQVYLKFGEKVSVIFETFREMLAYQVWYKYRIQKFAVISCGSILSETENIKRILTDIGFNQQLVSGSGDFLGIFDREDCSIIYYGDPEDKDDDFLFKIGGKDLQTIHDIITELITNSSICIEVDKCIYKNKITKSNTLEWCALLVNIDNSDSSRLDCLQVKKTTVIKEVYEKKVIGCANNEEKAFELYRKFKPNIIIIDLSNPQFDSLDFIKEILEIDNSLSIYLIGGDWDNVFKALKLGASGYLKKYVKSMEDIERIQSLYFEKVF